MIFGKYVNKYYLRYAFFFLLGIAMLVLVDMAQLKIPEVLGSLVDMFEGQTITEVIKEQVFSMISTVLIVAAIMCVGRIIWRLSIFHAASHIEADIRHQMYLKAERLSQTFYHSTKVGNIINWFTTDIDTIKEFFGWGTIMMVDAFFMTALTIYKMTTLSGALTLVSFIPIILIVVWGVFVERHLSMKWRNRQAQNDKLYDFSQENFTGIRVIKAFVKETQQLHAFAKVARKNKDMNIDYVRLSVLFDVFISVIVNSIIGLILGFGAWFVYQTVVGQPIYIFGILVELSAGELVQYVGYFDILVWPMMALGQIFTMRSRAKGSLNRITAFLDQKEDIKSPEDGVNLQNCKGEIIFNNMSFAYPDGLMPSLENINCTIKPGETIGIVGKIGSGKTTLVNSLLRLYNLEPNSILIDGIDIMKVNIPSLRDAIGYVPQDNFLFSDKISNNIAFANANLSDEEIENAAEFADVHDNIVGFKDGYETISGERGVTLSGGQKQRISIARAFVKDAPIMIMDDSVSAVDVKTEEKILKNIKEKRAGKTTIIVASRISTVQHLDKIMVLNDGKLEAFDCHEKLLKISKTYKTLAYLQQLEAEVSGGNK